FAVLRLGQRFAELRVFRRAARLVVILDTVGIDAQHDEYAPGDIRFVQRRTTPMDATPGIDQPRLRVLPGQPDEFYQAVCGTVQFRASPGFGDHRLLATTQYYNSVHMRRQRQLRDVLLQRP